MEDGSMQNSISFPQMIELSLNGLTNLKSFYPGKHTLECPSLQILSVYQCEALRMFSFNHLVFSELDQVDEIHDMAFQIALFSFEKVSPNLKELSLYAKDALKILNGYCRENLFHNVEVLRLQCFEETPITFLNGFHAMFPNVVTLQVRGSSSETLFLTAASDPLYSQSSKKIRNLWLFELEQLRFIWQEDFPVDHFVVQYLEGLSIGSCPNLITLINEDKSEEDIIFENLEILDITSLSSLRSFCYGKQTFIFPSLLHLIVQGCPQMEIFSSGVTVAPFLTAVKVENEKKRWKVDLNTTIKQLFVDQ
ncbi:rpp4C4, partial [Trifolium medium]|nr:rpp4C4 [Trifolium medium]